MRKAIDLHSMKIKVITEFHSKSQFQFQLHVDCTILFQLYIGCGETNTCTQGCNHTPQP